MLLTVFDRYNQKRTDLSPNDNGTQVKEIQADNILTLSFTLYEHVALDVNDYVDYMGERYWLMEKYRPKQKSTVEWEYNVKLYGIESLIKRFLVLKTVDGEDEPVFTLTAPPREHVAMIVQCINDGMGDITDFKVGTVEGTENITIDYEGKYCDAALKEIAEKVGAEWWAEGQTFNVCRCEHGEEITLGYGKGLTEIDNDTADNTKFYTRLFPIGSSKNIDREEYGYSRLQLPSKARYVDVNTDKYGIIHHYEASAFADIYPRRIGVVSSVRSEEVTGKDGTPFKIYYFRDDSLNFDPNEYELSQLVKRVSFQDGSELAGQGNEEDGNYFFEVNYNSDTREFEIITIWPYDNDIQLPNDTLIPKAGDKYILWNIRMPSEYYALAEEEFLTAVEKYNEQHAIDVSRYKAPTDHVYIEDNNIDLFVGRRVRLESNKYFPEVGYRKSRITKITRKVNMPSQMDIEISDALSTGSLTKIGDDITDVKNYTKGIAGSISLPDIIRSWDKTLPTDNNLFSARRSQQEFLSKVHNDTARGVLTIEKQMRMLAGLATEDYDTPGNADNMLGHGFELVKDMATGRTRLEVDELLVRLKAWFSELEIRRLSYLGGNYVFSGAGSKVYHVEKVSDGWKCYFYSDDGSTATMNYWRVGDQARCQTFNLDGEGAYHNVSNKYYWRLVTSVGKGRIAGKMLADGSADEAEYQWAVLSDTDFDGASVPEAGDSLVQMGNRNDTNRQGFIYLMTEGASAPAIQIYNGVGSKYPYYHLPDPLVQLSPHGNILYGEFHSVANGGASIDDLLSGLSAELAAVRGQTDQKYEIWLYAHSPLPTATDDGVNAPASDWTTDEQKSLHLQDVFYDIQTEPASSGGRAWRWMVVNGRYCWVPITDQDTLSSLERIANVAGDGVLTGGAEKGRVLVDWLRVVSELKKYHEQAVLYQASESSGGYDISTPLNVFITAFERLGRLLNGDNELSYDLTTGDVATPLWLQDLQTSTTISDPAAYRAVWDGYYYALADLLKAISVAAKSLADKALSDIEAMGEDNVLTAVEKLSVLREWGAVYKECPVLKAGALKAHVSYTDYEQSYYQLGNYLVDLTTDSTSSRQGYTIKNKTVDGKTYNFSVDYGNPLMLAFIQGSTNIDGSVFKTYWTNYYMERCRLLEAIGNEHVNVFVQEGRPSPPYKAGDQWVVPSTGKMLLCVKGRDAGETGDDSDWLAMEDVTEKRDPRILIAALVNMVYNYYGDTIRDKGSDAYLTVYLGNKPSSGHARGDFAYTNGDVHLCTDTWGVISNETLRMSFKSLHEVIGSYNLRIFRTRPSRVTALLYDTVCTPLVFTDTNLPEGSKYRTVEGGIQIQMYNGDDWEVLQESAHSLIENLKGYVRALAMKSAGDYSTAAGFITSGDWADLFAKAEDADGNKIAEAHLSAFVQKDAQGNIVSGVRIGADQITFEGKTFSIGAEHITLSGTDQISLLISGVKSGLADTGIDIQHGKITLNANTTTINGNLNLYDENNNGLTVYDENKIARVNIQSDSIGDIAQMANDTYTYIAANSTSSTSSFNNTATTPSIGTLAANKTIEIDNITVKTYGSGSSPSYPTTYSASLKIEILNGSTVVTTQTVAITRQNSYGDYKASAGFRYTTKASGTYCVRYTISGISSISSNSSVYLLVNARIQTSDVVQTLIGADGFYSHPGANKLLWLNKDELQFRFGFGGLRLSMPSEQSFAGRLDTIAGVYGSAPNFKPVWFPFHNITPMFSPSFGSAAETIINTGSTGKYVYKIDPFNDRGICYVHSPAMDANFNEQDSWVLLPSGDQTYNGYYVGLPEGYTITVINGTKKNVYVTGNVSNHHACKIIDANRNENYYCSLNGTQSRDTYIYVGSYSDGSIIGNVDFWIALHDTQ